VELVDGPDSFTWAPDGPRDGLPSDTRGIGRERPSQAATGDIGPMPKTPGDGLVSFEQAVTETQTRTRVTRVKRLR
jgi:hypothetical protein